NAKRKISWVHFDVSKHGVNKKLYAKLYKKFDNIFAVSEEAKQKLIQQIPIAANKSEVFMNIVQSNLIREMAKEKVIFDYNYKGIKIVTVGRLSREKGQDLAIKVLSKLRKNGYEVRWYCIGDGNSRMEFEELINKYELTKHFILVGTTTNPYPYIASADLYVQPSRHEGFCLTLAEAKCLNKPIITTDFTGAYEQIQDGYTGLIVECNENALYKNIKYLFDNPSEMRKLTVNLENSNKLNVKQSVIL
ncbi:glycosyltransferase, partial [Bacillus sp. JJ1764]|uniref:glycosyltransferase n=1 Tax=Bacillus sp. JJ1764 TaxID=3122964 RepID=UPI002FFDAC09